MSARVAGAAPHRTRGDRSTARGVRASPHALLLDTVLLRGLFLEPLTELSATCFSAVCPGVGLCHPPSESVGEMDVTVTQGWKMV